MAIAYDNSAKGSSTNLDWTFSHTCTGDNLILVVSVTSFFNTFTVTYNGFSMTQIGGFLQDVGQTGKYHSMWYLIAPSTGANNVRIVTSGQAFNIVQAESASYTGCNQSSQPDGYTDGTVGTLTSSYSISHTTIADNCWVIMGGFNGFTGNTPSSAGTATTLRQQETTYEAGSRICDNNSAKTPAGSVTLTLTNTTNNNYTGKSISISPFTAVSGPTNLKSLNTNLKANIKTINGNPIANVKSYNTIT